MTTTSTGTIVILPFEMRNWRQFDLYPPPYYTYSKMLNQYYKLRYYTSRNLSFNHLTIAMSLFHTSNFTFDEAFLTCIFMKTRNLFICCT